MSNPFASVDSSVSDANAEIKKRCGVLFLGILTRHGTPRNSVILHVVSIRLARYSKAMAWHKDEENDNGHADEDSDQQDHHGAFIQEVSDVWFADA